MEDVKKPKNKRTVQKLTARQEKFCQCVVQGMSYKAAYQAAYTCNGTDQMALNEGSQLMMKPHIQARIKELQAPVVAAVQVSAISETQKIKDLLWERIEICRQTGDEAAIARYTDQLNKLNAAYKDVKPLEDNKDAVTNLDNETLLKIVNG